MTSVLVIDPDPGQCANLEKELQESNQFGRVSSCNSFSSAEPLVESLNIQVVLIDRKLAMKTKAFEAFQSKYPDIGLVLVSDSGQLPNTSDLEKVGVHAQTCRFASPIEKMSSIAKALVARLRPRPSASRFVKKLLKE